MKLFKMNTRNVILFHRDTIEKTTEVDVLKDERCCIIPILDVLQDKPSFLPEAISQTYEIRNTKIIATTIQKKYYTDLVQLLKVPKNIISYNDSVLFLKRNFLHFYYSSCFSILASIYLCSKNFMILDFKPSNIVINLDGDRKQFNIVLIDNEFSIYTFSQVNKTSFYLNYSSEEYNPSGKLNISTLVSLINRFLDISLKYMDIYPNEYKSFIEELRPKENMFINVYIEDLLKKCKNFLKRYSYSKKQLEELERLLNEIQFKDIIDRTYCIKEKNDIIEFDNVFKTIIEDLTNNEEERNLIINSLTSIYKNFKFNKKRKSFLNPKKLTKRIFLNASHKLEEHFHKVEPTLYCRFIDE